MLIQQYPVHLVLGFGRPLQSSLGAPGLDPLGPVVNIPVPKKAIKQNLFSG